MTTEIIFVGTNLLFGNDNKKSVYIASEILRCGIELRSQTFVENVLDSVLEAAENASKKSDVVFIVGGMGDDNGNTSEKALLSILKPEQECGDDCLKLLLANGAKTINNTFGDAQGIIAEKEDKLFIVVPENYEELEYMFETEIIKCLKEKNMGEFYSSMLKICGKSKEEITSKIEDIVAENKDVKFTIGEKYREVHIMLSSKADDPKVAKKAVKDVVKALKGRLEDCIYTTDEKTTLEKSVVDLLIANKLKVATAESCTGGLLAGRLTNVPGVSDVFKMGCVTYSNKVKRRLLRVKGSSLDKHGAVSAKVVKEMALGVKFMVPATDIIISISGIAGPDGGTEEKPVGTVWIGCNFLSESFEQEYHFKGDREEVRECTVTEALVIIRKCILKYYSNKQFGK